MKNNIPGLKKRYLFKITRSVMSSAMSMITLPLITRSMGAEQYGLYNYLNIFFKNIINFFDIWTYAFYPKLCQRPGDQGILWFVIIYDAVLLIATFMALGLLIIYGKIEIVLTTQSIKIAFLALLLTWMLLINQKISSFMDALGNTITNEVVSMVMRIALTAGLVILFINDRLNLVMYLYIQNITLAVIFLILLAFAVKYFSRNEKSSSVKKIAKEFKDYSLPLFWAEAMVIMAIFADRWLLQFYSGAAAQGYFSLGYSLGSVCLILTAGLAPLLLREFAIAYEKNDKTRLVSLFSKYLYLFFVITAIISCFMAVHGDWLALLIGGEDFSEAAIPVMFMVLVSLYYTYGHFSASLMMATDRTRVYGGINIFITILGLPVTYFFLAPQQYFGLNLGSTGLAIKSLILTIIASNIQLRFNTKYLGIGMARFVAHQALVLILFMVFAFICKSLVSASFDVGILALLFSGVPYLFLVFTFILIFPSIIAMTRVELLYHIKTPSAFFKS